MRKKLADIIEDLILQQLASTDSILISRNQLAQELSCAPSQISYVLQSRFNQERGFVCESKRGSGGFVRICRLIEEHDLEEIYREQEALKSWVESLIMSPEELKYTCQLRILVALKEMLEEERCTKIQLSWIRGALVHVIQRR